MDKKKLDILLRKGMIEYKGKIYVELESRRKKFEELLKDEIALEKSLKSHKEKLESIVIYGIETPEQLENKNQNINRITCDLERCKRVLEDLRAEKTEFFNKSRDESKAMFKEYEKEFRDNSQKIQKQKEIDSSYLDLLENLKV